MIVLFSTLVSEVGIRDAALWVFEMQFPSSIVFDWPISYPELRVIKWFFGPNEGHLSLTHGGRLSPKGEPHHLKSEFLTCSDCMYIHTLVLDGQLSRPKRSFLAPQQIFYFYVLLLAWFTRVDLQNKGTSRLLGHSSKKSHSIAQSRTYKAVFALEFISL